MKQCWKCGCVKALTEYNKCVGRKDGLQTKCRTCDNAHTRNHQKENWATVSQYQLSKQAEYCSKNINYKLSRNFRSRLSCALKATVKNASAVKDLGCSIEGLKLHLESKFQPGMTWENYGRTGWHVDHIKPLSAFDLSDRNELLKACHYTNLQPLWASDNLIKGARSMVK